MNSMKWTPREIEWLMIGRDILSLTFGQCVDHMEREYPERYYSRRSVIGAYHRAMKRKLFLPQDVWDEVKGKKTILQVDPSQPMSS